MKADICTIPLNEVFSKKDGCPICRMRADLEERALDFVLGAAMMEPDVRHETNRLGFCPEHLQIMHGRSNRLSFALVLESHLEYINNEIIGKKHPQLFHSELSSAQQAAQTAKKMQDSCYVCERVSVSLDKALDTFFVMWKKDADFRKNVAEQPIFCLRDYGLLLDKGAKKLDKKSFPDFYKVVANVSANGLSGLKDDVSGFCKMFDYHNNGKDFGRLHDAVKNAVDFLCGEVHL